ncbi:DNA-binding protein Alba [Candidatus Parvarchaeota archaeon]|jgi:DNA-binding protein|uniref:DNA/RNA-binding protein Alba n=1 Tax=Candidatus Acidifodinimicrobium mancum TaxID=2898728 RepID=A0A8T3UTT2_9ARCH|nr:DNA-binding protein Alba [Candidatus Acidifodinimicrobium mancum]
MENDIVFVGKKPTMSYVLAILTHINSGHDKITLKARGMLISKAVDISQLVTRKFSKELKVTEVSIGSEEIDDKEGNKRIVSFISIDLKK